MPATITMVIDSVVRSSGSSVRSRAERAACASRASRARWRSTAGVDRLPYRHGQQHGHREREQAGQHAAAKVGGHQPVEGAESPELQQADRGDGEDQRAGDADHHGVIECEARLDPWIARHGIGTWRQPAVERSQDDDLREPRQHEHHDDAAEVAQHSRVAVLHLDRPGEPQRRQQQQRQPVPDARQPVSQRGDRAARVRGRAQCLPHCPALLQDDDAEKDVIDQPDRLQQRVVRGARQAEQQPDLGERVAEHADHHDAPGPAHGVGGQLVGQCQQAQARLTGGEKCPRDGQDGGAQRIGVDHGKEHETWPIRAAKRGRRDQVADQQKSERRQQFEDAAAKHQRHAPQQCEGHVAAAVGCFGLAAFGARLAVFLRRHVAVGSLTDQSPDRALYGAARRPLDREADRQHQRQAPGRVQQDIARPGVGRHHLQPEPQLRHAADRSEAGDHLVGDVVQEPGGAHQHLGAKTVRGDRHGGRRRGGGGRRGLRDGSQRGEELVALLRVLQDLEGPARVVGAGADLRAGANGGHEGKEAGEDQQAQKHHGSGQQSARSVNKMAPISESRRGG